MTRAQTFLLLAAVILASLSAVRIGGHEQPVLAFAAMGVMLLVGYLRIRATLSGKTPKRTFDAYDRALQIQKEREKKFWR